MKTSKFIIIFCLISIFINKNLLYSQTEINKENVLSEAQKLYENGLVDNIPSMLRPYIEKGFSKKEKKEAYLLIILSYLFDDHKQEATKVLYEFMVMFPEFKPSENDPNDLKYLYNLKNFKANISFAVGPITGYISTIPAIDRSFNIPDFEAEKEVIAEGSIPFGIQINKRIYDYIDLRIDALYTIKKYGFNQLTPTDDITQYSETLTQITVPLWLMPYITLKKDHRIYLKVGGGVNFLLNSSADLDLASNSNTFDTKGKRNNITKFIGGGAGFAFKIPRGFISVEGTYFMGLQNIVNDDERNAIAELENTYSYIDDDFKLNNLMFSISYIFLFYNLREDK